VQEKKEVEKMNVNKLETTLREQVEAGIMTDFEMRRIMARATGGIYLDDEQKAQFELAKQYIDSTLEVLNKLHVISPKRVGSTRTKLEKAIVKHIVNGGTLSDDGTPDVSNLEFWE
tara:strand:+ start:1437 stop:1784 length:348 start_codon:yes stop_codon:yes gene_type:complete